MSARATARVNASSPPASRGLVGVAVAFALLLQALFAVPLAIRMTADAMQWLQLGPSICAAASDDGSAAGDHRPIDQLPAHNHAQCLVCRAHALPLGLLAIVLCVLVVLLGQIAVQSAAAAEPPWRRHRYGSYHSRAPPLTA